jgi:hypothetical protein
MTPTSAARQDCGRPRPSAKSRGWLRT